MTLFLNAFFYSAPAAMLRFSRVIPQAAAAWFFVAAMSIAHQAVHPAGGKQISPDGLCRHFHQCTSVSPPHPSVLLWQRILKSKTFPAGSSAKRLSAWPHPLRSGPIHKTQPAGHSQTKWMFSSGGKGRQVSRKIGETKNRERGSLFPESLLHAGNALCFFHQVCSPPIPPPCFSTSPKKFQSGR